MHQHFHTHLWTGKQRQDSNQARMDPAYEIKCPGATVAAVTEPKCPGKAAQGDPFPGSEQSRGFGGELGEGYNNDDADGYDDA